MPKDETLQVMKDLGLTPDDFRKKCSGMSDDEVKAMIWLAEADLLDAEAEELTG